MTKENYKILLQSLKKYRLFSLFLILLVTLFSQTYAQDEPTFYRFQYHKLSWKAYYTKKFNIYFPANSADSLFRFIVKETPDAIERIKATMIKDAPKNINIIIYPSIDQLYESNIGLFETQKFTFPTFAYKGTRIVLAFNGSYTQLKQQLYESLARSVWETQMKEDGKKGSGKKSGSKKGSANENGIPFWFKEGAIRYLSNGWTIESDDKLRNSFQQNNFTSWQQFLNYEPRLAGNAFCYFLTEKFYRKAVAQTVFQLKKKKSLSRAIKLITKRNLDTLNSACFDYYKARYKIQADRKENIQSSMCFKHKKGIVQNVAVNPLKDLIAYTLYEKNKRTVYVYNVKEQTTGKITTYKLPPWIDEYSKNQYPLIQWHSNGRQLYIAKPSRKGLSIRKYDHDGKVLQKIILYGVAGLCSFQPISETEFLLSAYRKGQTDVVSYNDDKEKFTPITDDEYDDTQPIVSTNKKETIFVSERPKELTERRIFFIGVGFKKDTLWQGIYSINKNNELKPIVTDTTHFIKWVNPLLLKDDKILASCTKTGTEKFVTIDLLRGNITQLGNFHPFQYLSRTDEISFFKANKDSIFLYQQPIDLWIQNNKANPSDSTSPWLLDYKKNLKNLMREDSLLKRRKDTTHYFLENVFKSSNTGKNSKKGKKADKKKKIQKPDIPVPYVLQLHSAYFTAQVNNDYFINRYQPYVNYQGQFKFPEVGALTKGGFTDILENHHFTISYKIPSATDGSDFFVRYENTEKKYDWGFSYFRKVETLKPDPNSNWVDENGRKYPQNQKGRTHYYEFFVRKPLTYYSALGFQAAIRQDETIFLATDKYSLDFPTVTGLWSINTISYKLNKMQPTITGLYKGFNVNNYLDLLKGFDRKSAFVFGIQLNATYHQPIYKYITLVTQLHTGYSGGEEKILYNMGGVDNNLTPRVDSSVHFPQSAPYAFQTLITPLRGYMQSGAYGNIFLLTNADLYFPIFQTLIPLETPLPFINNLQLGMLNDFGTAKETWNDLNPKNDSWLWAYGLSVRSTLAGYSLRLEVAWPGSFHKKPVWYFSMKL